MTPSTNAEKHNNINVVPATGLEPIRPKPRDFKFSGNDCFQRVSPRRSAGTNRVHRVKECLAIFCGWGLEVTHIVRYVLGIATEDNMRDRISIYKASDGSLGAIIDGVAAHYFVVDKGGNKFNVIDGDRNIAVNATHSAALAAMLADWDKQ